jgi:YHS domain-containing protein
VQNGRDWMTVRRFSALALVALSVLPACHRPQRSGSGAAVPRAEMRTIDNVDPRPVVLDPPPVLREEAAPPKPKGEPWETPEPVVLTPEDEQVRASLPFAPAMALDPVTGSKISILAHTPTVEYKGRIYYFASEENKRAFGANPDQYAKGLFKGM